MRATFAAVYNSLPSLSADIEMQVEAAKAETEEQVCEVVPTPPAPTRASLLPATSERSDSTSFSAYPRPPRVSGQLTLSLEQDHVLSAQASKDMRRAVGQSWLTNRFGYPPKGNQQAKLVGQWAEERFLQHTASHQLGYVRRRFFGFSLMLLASYIYAQTRIYVDTVTGDSEFVHDEQNEKLFSVATLLVGAWLIPRAQSRGLERQRGQLRSRESLAQRAVQAEELRIRASNVVRRVAVDPQAQTKDVGFRGETGAADLVARHLDLEQAVHSDMESAERERESDRKRARLSSRDRDSA